MSSSSLSNNSKAAANATNAQVRPRPLATSIWLRIVYSLLLPLIATTYLTFCYVVYYRTVPLIDVYGSYENLGRVKAGITSISIILFSIALWPLKNLLHDLKSEEFLRTLNQHQNGVPLSTLNTVSSPSSSFFVTITAILNRYTSGYFTLAFISGFLVIATATLAPAALTVQAVQFESDVFALAVGAILPESVVNGSETRSSGVYESDHLPFIIQNKIDQAASIGWAEVAMDIPYSFIPPNTALTTSDASATAYIVPFPNISTATSARWLSDIISIRPSCDWAKTNITEQQFSTIWANGSFKDDFNAFVNLPDHQVDVQLELNSLFTLESAVDFVGPSPALSQSRAKVINSTNGNLISTGITMWAMGQCISGCPFRYPDENLYIDLDLSNIPKTNFIFPDRTYEISFLVCTPNAQIVSGEIKTNGTAFLKVTVMPEDNDSIQRNLHPAQSTLLLSMALASFAAASGPTFRKIGYGTDLQMQFVFGKDVSSRVDRFSGTARLTPEPLANITEKYARLLQSATKPFLMPGVLGTTYVPARVFEDIVVFQVSLPHVIVSTVLLTFLSLFVIVAHFRKGKGDMFTLFSVASSLRGSGIPEQFSQHEKDMYLTEQKLVSLWGVRMVSLHPTEDGLQRQLHLN